jgi:hypothetical protein
MEHRWRTAFFVLLALSTALIGRLLYRVVDQADLQYDTESNVTSAQESAAALAGVLPRLAPGATRADVLTALRRASPRGLIISDSAGVAMDGARFRFANGRLRSVTVE